MSRTIKDLIEVREREIIFEVSQNIKINNFALFIVPSLYSFK